MKVSLSYLSYLIIASNLVFCAIPSAENITGSALYTLEKLYNITKNIMPRIAHIEKYVSSVENEPPESGFKSGFLNTNDAEFAFHTGVDFSWLLMTAAAYYTAYAAASGAAYYLYEWNRYIPGITTWDQHLTGAQFLEKIPGISYLTRTAKSRVADKLLNAYANLNTTGDTDPPWLSDLNKIQFGERPEHYSLPMITEEIKEFTDARPTEPKDVTSRMNTTDSALTVPNGNVVFSLGYLEDNTEQIQPTKIKTTKL